MRTRDSFEQMRAMEAAAVEEEAAGYDQATDRAVAVVALVLVLVVKWVVADGGWEVAACVVAAACGFARGRALLAVGVGVVMVGWRMVEVVPTSVLGWVYLVVVVDWVAAVAVRQWQANVHHAVGKLKQD